MFNIEQNIELGYFDISDILILPSFSFLAQENNELA